MLLVSSCFSVKTHCRFLVRQESLQDSLLKWILSFCFLGKVSLSLSLSFLKDNFVKYSWLAVLFFSFSTLNILSNFLLSNLLIALMGGSWGEGGGPRHFHCMKWLFFFSIFKILSDFWEFYYNMFWWNPLWIESVWEPVSIMYLDVHLSSLIWEFYNHYSKLPAFLSSFSGFL